MIPRLHTANVSFIIIEALPFPFPSRIASPPLKETVYDLFLQRCAEYQHAHSMESFNLHFMRSQNSILNIPKTFELGSNALYRMVLPNRKTEEEAKSSSRSFHSLPLTVCMRSMRWTIFTSTDFAADTSIHIGNPTNKGQFQYVRCSVFSRMLGGNLRINLINCHASQAAKASDVFRPALSPAVNYAGMRAYSLK